MFGSYAPFGASMTAAVPFKNLLSSIAGVSLGYILFTPGGSFRYVATVLAIGAIRWTLSDLKKINASRFFAPVVAFIPMLATGLVLAAVGDFAGSLVAMCVIEALLAAVGGYFFSRSIRRCNGRYFQYGRQFAELCCRLLCFWRFNGRIICAYGKDRDDPCLFGVQYGYGLSV